MRTLADQQAGIARRHRVLIVDDEPDVHAVTKMSLRGMSYRGRAVDLATASSGKEAVESMRARPDTAVVLLDVVMETTSAGLDAVREIRGALGNGLVRILLRTGQPGSAPERKTIDEYDIDGYLGKAELTSTRLYAAVRTALKAYEELVELERHRETLSLLHESALSMRAYEPLDVLLQRVLATAAAIAPTPFAVLEIQTFEEQGNPRRSLLHLSTTDGRGEEAALQVAARIDADPAARDLSAPGRIGEGTLVPVVLHRDLGHGWIWLEGPPPDEMTVRALALLAGHAANGLYATVARSILASRETPFLDSMDV